MAFHKAIIRLGGIELMSTLTDGLFIHMRAVRAVTMTQDNRALRSVRDHRAIIAALEARDAERAERLVREHTMGLAEHVERFLYLSHEMGEAGARSSPGEGFAVKGNLHRGTVADAPTASARGTGEQREHRHVRHV